MQTEINLETLLPWSAAKKVPTANGDRLLRKAEPTEEFWQLWRTQKAQLRDAGISASEWPKGSGKWQVCLWQPLSAEVLAEKAANMEASRATDADITIPGPAGYSYLGYQKAGVLFMLKRFGWRPKSQQ